MSDLPHKQLLGDVAEALEIRFKKLSACVIPLALELRRLKVKNWPYTPFSLHQMPFIDFSTEREFRKNVKRSHSAQDEKWNINRNSSDMYAMILTGEFLNGYIFGKDRCKYLHEIAAFANDRC